MYELMIVARVDKSDQLISRVEKALKDAAATGLKVDSLGKKQLAYPIRKQTDAAYYVVNFEAEASAIGPFASKLRLEQEDLLRYLIIKTRNVKIKKKRKIVEDEVKVKEAPKVTVVTKAAEVKSEKVSKVRKVPKVSRAKKGTNRKKTKK